MKKPTPLSLIARTFLATCLVLSVGFMTAVAQPFGLVPVWGAPNELVVIDGGGPPPVPVAPFALNPPGANISSYDAAVSSDGSRVYVAVYGGVGGDAIQMVDIFTGAATSIDLGGFPAPGNPQAITMSADDTRVYALAGNVLTVVDSDLASGTFNTIIGRYTIPGASSAFGAIAINPDNTQLYVGMHTNPRAITIWDVSAVPVGAPVLLNTVPNPGFTTCCNIADIKFSPDGSKAYVSNGWLHVFDTVTQTYTASFVPLSAPAGTPLPQGMALTPDGAYLYIASASFARGGKTVNVVDTATDTEVAYIRVPRAQRDVAIAGNRAFAVTFAQTGANEVYTIDTDAVAAAVAGGTGTVSVPAHLATTRLPNRAERIAAADPSPANEAPTADAGPDQIVECGNGRTDCGCALATLDGSGSSDPDGDALTFLWEHDATGVTYVGAIQTGLPLLVGTHSFTLTVDDGNGGTAIDTVTITVQDTTIPVLVGTPDDITVECDNVPEPANVTATDNCSEPSLTFTENRVDGNCPNNYTLIRTWVATDAYDNVNTWVQTITVQDTTPPTDWTTDLRDIFPNETPITFSVASSDNCSDAVVLITNVTRHRVNKKGKIILLGGDSSSKSSSGSKSNSDLPAIVIDGDSFTVNDSGGVGAIITVYATATDACGNTSDGVFTANVLKPGKSASKSDSSSGSKSKSKSKSKKSKKKLDSF